VEYVTIRELRNHGGEVVERVTNGEAMIITRDGKPVAELRPLPGPALSAAALVQRWHRLPHVDPDGLRTDVDGVLDPAL
jgi:prevent-host-death family protein